MIYGILIYNDSLGRPDIVSDSGHFYGGLHCGDCLELLDKGHWIPVRLEQADEWYLTFNNCLIPFETGTKVRI